MHRKNELEEELIDWMKIADIFVRYRKKYKVTTNSNHQRTIYDNVLQRQFTVDKPNKAYVSDISYV